MTTQRVKKALADIRAGRMVILVDDEHRENEGDLCMAAQKVSPEAINFMAKYGRGLICLALDDKRLKQLDLPLMVADNTSQFGTAFTVSVEARHGVTTGISAADRAHTILTAIAPDAEPDDLVRPGHIFPLRAQPGGVLVRTGQTEGSVDLARMANFEAAGVICEIMNDDGTMARMKDLEIFAKQHALRIVTIAELIEYRMQNESLVTRLFERELEHPRWGKVTIMVYGSSIDEKQHLIICKGQPHLQKSPLVRVQPGYVWGGIVGELFGRDREYVTLALQKITNEGNGMLLCIERDANPEPLESKIQRLFEACTDSVSSNSEGILREIGVGAQILRDCGMQHIRLLSNNPKRLAGIEGFGLHIDEMIELAPTSSKKNKSPKFQIIA